MGKFRSKLKGASKGKRWAKGQSSSSNPETKRFRDIARSRFFQENLGPSKLTTEALQKHDRIQAFSSGENTKSECGSYTESVSQGSFQTMDSFASEWSNCSNMSFNRFLRIFRSDSALHKEMLAILAAVAEVIKENGGTETPTEYYCALLTTLEQFVNADDSNENQITAVLSLLNMGIRTVPESVLQLGFNEVVFKLLHILQEYSSSQNNIIIKSLIGIISVFLKVQEIAVWSNSSTTQVFLSLVNTFGIHPKPKWRKAAQNAICDIIKSDRFAGDNIANIPADIVAEFCEKTLNTCLGGGNGEVYEASIKANQTTILHVVGLLKDVVCYFSKSNMKKTCEMMLKLMTLNYPYVTLSSIQVLHSLFSHQSAVVPAKLNAQLISALYEYQPSPSDTQPTIAWLAVMQQAHIHLADVDIPLAMAALPKIFVTISQLWLSDKVEVASSATRALEALLKDAVLPACETEVSVESHASKLLKCFNTIESCLSYQYNTSWHQVLYVIKVMFEVAGKMCGHMLTSCLKNLAQLRDSYKFSYNNELEHAVGAAVQSMGPELVLKELSLQKESGDLNMDRSWLLPILKENIKTARLGFWIEYILPLAVSCQRKSIQLSEKSDGIGAHSYELLSLQLWNLLPSFCICPTDIKDSFKGIAKTLGTAIADRKDIRLAVMAALRRLITNAKEKNNTEDLNEIAKFDKNYLPILFNLYSIKPSGSDEEGQRLAALDTIKVFLTVTKPELRKQLFIQALEHLESLNDATDPNDLFRKESIMDLIKTLIRYQSVEELSNVFNSCIKTLPDLKDKEQKKAYRLLEEICSSETEGCKTFIQNNRKVVQKMLVKSLNSASVSSKGARLRCLNYLIKAQPTLDQDSKLIKTAIPEAILCCKDINERCRTVAYTLLNTIGETLQSHNQMKQFLGMVFVGLEGTPQMVNATILAFCSILHNFSGSLGFENINLIFEHIIGLLSSPSREVVGSCLSFIKVYCKTLPSPMVGSSLPKIIESLCKMTEDCKRHYRIKVRDILCKLVRKYGVDSIKAHIPENDVVMYKRLKNIRKIIDRKNKKKETEDVEMDEDEFSVKPKTNNIDEILADSESESEDEVKEKKKTSTWIQEDAESIVDFIDPSVRNKIRATNPSQSTDKNMTKKSDKNRGFKTADDGRLIIDADDDSSDDESEKKKRKKFISLSDTDEDSEEDMSSAETAILTNRKRKRNATDSLKSGFSGKSGKSQPPSKYKPGGSGIHRDISTSSMYSGAGGSEYKAKKAGGDIKKKDKADPYAYLPLKRNLLNKRKKAKLRGQFKNIVKSARIGAKKGSKANKKLRNNK